MIGPLGSVPPAEHSAVGGIWIPTEGGKFVFYSKRHRVFLQICPVAGLSGERQMPTVGLFGSFAVVPILGD
jgi:hypothetical protein